MRPGEALKASKIAREFRNDREIRLARAVRDAIRTTNDYRKACDDCGKKILKLEAQVKAEQARLRAQDDILRERTEERDHLAERCADLHESLVEIRKADQLEIDALKKKLEAHGRCPDEFSEAVREATTWQSRYRVAVAQADAAEGRLTGVVDALIEGLIRRARQ